MTKFTSAHSKSYLMKQVEQQFCLMLIIVYRQKLLIKFHSEI